MKITIDDGIDELVNGALSRMESESPEAFDQRLANLSGITKMALKTMVKEQIAAEDNGDRKTQLLKLDLILNQH